MQPRLHGGQVCYAGQCRTTDASGSGSLPSAIITVDHNDLSCTCGDGKYFIIAAIGGTSVNITLRTETYVRLTNQSTVTNSKYTVTPNYPIPLGCDNFAVEGDIGGCGGMTINYSIVNQSSAMQIFKYMLRQYAVLRRERPNVTLATSSTMPVCSKICADKDFARLLRCTRLEPEPRYRQEVRAIAIARGPRRRCH